MENQNISKQRRRSIRTLVGLFFIVNVSLVIFNYVLTLISNNTAEQDARYVEISKDNEDFIQKLNYILTAIVNGEAELKDVLKNSIERFDLNLSALKTGGQILLNNETVVILPSGRSALPKIEELTRSWLELKEQLKIIIDEPIQLDSNIARKVTITLQLPDSLQKDSLKQASVEKDTTFKIIIENPRVQKSFLYAQANLDDVLTKARELSNIFTNNYLNSQNNQNSILFFTVLANLILLIAGGITIITSVINPLAKISRTAKDVAQGDVNSHVVYRRTDEIGDVAESLNLLVDNFKQYADFANKVGQGDFEIDFDVKSNKDILGYSLLSMRDSLSKASEEDKKRNWANDGFTLISNVLRNTNRNVEEFCYDIVSNLVKYIEANQGGFFLLIDGKEKYLELKSSFAYNRRRYEEKKIYLGQGLLGQAVLEKEITYIKKAPEGYIKVSSGLGDSSPGIILIIPLVWNDEIYGAIEIASFKHFEDYQLNFIASLSENIASTIASVRVSENTKILLEETRQNAEKMRAQEEEMRQNMEELATNQEQMQKNQLSLEEYKRNLEREVETRTIELEEKEKELFSTLSRLEGVMESSQAGIVALDTDFRITASNSRFVDFIKDFFYKKTEIGQNWLDLSEGATLLEKQKSYWNRSLLGEEFTIEEYFETGQHKAWYEIAFSPIYGKDNLIVGASMLQRDVTERKQSQRAVERTARILDNSTNEVYIFRADNYHFVNANERGRKNLGYTQDELDAITMFSIEVNQNVDHFESFIEPLKSKKLTNLMFTTYYRRKDGSSYDVEVNLQYFADEDPPLFAAIVQDITQRKQNEAQLKEAITRFDLVSSATNEGLWEMYVENDNPINPDNKFWYSKQFKSLLGYNDEEFANKLDSWSSLLHPEDKETVLQSFYKHILDKTGSTPYDLEYRLLHKEGDYYWFSSTGETLRDEKGNPIRVAGTIRNIESRKRAERSLQEQTAQNEAILNANTNGIIAIDMKGRIFSANKSIETMFGYNKSELYGKNIKMLMNEDIGNKHDAYMKAYHETGVKKIIGTVREEVGKHKDGKSFPIELSVSEGTVGKRKFYIASIRNISQRKERDIVMDALQTNMNKIILLHSAPIFIHVGGLIRVVNPAFINFSGYTEAELINNYFIDLLLEESKSVFDRKLEEANEETYIVKFFKKDRTVVRITIQSTNLISTEGNKSQMCMIIGVE